MAITSLLGDGIYLPNPEWIGSLTQSLQSDGIFNAAANKFAFIGRVWTPDGASRSIQSVGFRFAGVTKGGATDVQVSLQDVSSTNGFPDEVADQTGLIGNANLIPGAYREVTFGSTRTVNSGDVLAVVFEYSTFVSGDNIQFGTVANRALTTYVASKNGGSWSKAGTRANLIFNFTDGSRGTFWGAAGGCTDISSRNFDSGSTPDEVAIEFELPCAMRISGAIFPLLTFSDASDFSVILYDGTTVLTSTTVDGNQVAGAFGLFPAYIPLTPTELLASHTYRVAIKPLTTNMVQHWTHDVSSSAHWGAWSGGIGFRYASRTDGGAWTTNATRRVLGMLQFNGIDSGGASGAEFRAAYIG